MEKKTIKVKGLFVKIISEKSDNSDFLATIFIPHKRKPTLKELKSGSRVFKITTTIAWPEIQEYQIVNGRVKLSVARPVDTLDPKLPDRRLAKELKSKLKPLTSSMTLKLMPESLVEVFIDYLYKYLWVDW